MQNKPDNKQHRRKKSLSVWSEDGYFRALPVPRDAFESRALTTQETPSCSAFSSSAARRPTHPWHHLWGLHQPHRQTAWHLCSGKAWWFPAWTYPRARPTRSTESKRENILPIMTGWLTRPVTQWGGVLQSIFSMKKLPRFCSYIKCVNGKCAIKWQECNNRYPLLNLKS